jgi:ribosome-associated protein
VKKETSPRDAKALAREALAAAYVKKAYQPVLLDVSSFVSYADCILIVSGRSIRQLEAIAEAIQGGLKELGREPLGVEGSRGDKWLLIDYGDLVIHLFYHPLREFYDLEGLWPEAERVELEVPDELRTVTAY